MTGPLSSDTPPDAPPPVTGPMRAPVPEPLPSPPRRPGWRFLLRHPAHWIALGFGSGLSPVAPGTAGTLWAWLAFVVFSRWLGDDGWLVVLAVGWWVGWWACTRTAAALNVEDPSAIVWDEVIAFWLVLWLAAPATLLGQAVAFGLFRFFDAAKPGPVKWADQRFKRRSPQQPVGWAQGFGILFDDLVAAGCTLLVIALWRWW
jgi:phosphatidylglycerophosphatase A